MAPEVHLMPTALRKLGEQDLRDHVQNELRDVFRARMRLARRRHHARAQAADDLLEAVGMRGDLLRRRMLEREPAGLLRVVVAVGAVLVKQAPAARERLIGRLAAAGEHRESGQGDGQREGSHLRCYATMPRSRLHQRPSYAFEMNSFESPA